MYYATQAFAWLERISRHKIAMCLLVMAMTMGIRIALLPRIPIPQPYVADEFSYLLGAETFASGRLTNPPHPMWVHFETFHELMQPTYMSKYPPGQALFLVMGWKLLGHPWFGVWISFGLFGACLCWMLQNWVPPVYAVLGTVVTLANISLLGYWMNSYWGGAVAASAGCLLLGALPRLARRVKVKDVVVAAIGLVLLANTRPYEGLVMSVAAFVALLFLRRRQQRSLTELFSLRCVIPLLLICGAGALLDGYYNYRVTGSAFLMPYAAYSQDYASHPPWIFSSMPTPPVYRHAVLKNSWENELEHFRKVRSNPSLNLTELLDQIFGFYCPSLLLFPVSLGILLSGSYRFWTAAAICCCVWCGLLIESVKAPHYIAGSVGLLPLLGMYGFRWLRVVGRSYGPALVLTLAALLCVQGVLRRGDERGRSWETRHHVVSPRMIATREAIKQGGRHLILVRYSAGHIDKSDDCVYNSADIDASQIVWARDMGEAKNRELVNYYQGGRKIWLYQADTDPSTLIPYGSVSQ
ncbi:MAG: hypothetical protein LAO23_12905 [Acidobacteriia bacterium]|nr:hypothetical protein [Terriglobia bacterium]